MLKQFTRVASWRPLAAVMAIGLTACQGADLDALESRPTVNVLAEEAAVYDQDLLPIRVGAVTSSIRRGERVGTHIYSPLSCDPIGGPIIWNAGRVQMLGQDGLGTISDYMREEGVHVTNDPVRVASGGLDDRDPAFLVVGRLESMAINACMKTGLLGRGTGGEALARVTWDILAYRNRSAVLVRQITTDGRFKSESPLGMDGVNILTVEAIGAAAGALARTPEFRETVSTNYAARFAEEEQREQDALSPMTIATAAESSVPMTEVLREARASAVRIDLPPSGHGSGVLISPRFVLTNQHVAGGRDVVDVVLATGRSVIGEVLRCHRGRDICLIQIERVGLPYRPIRIAEPEIGEDVWIIGAPERRANRGTVTRGIVSQYVPNRDGFEDILFDATVHGGNSGGPIFDRHGNLVGLVYAGQLDRDTGGPYN